MDLFSIGDEEDQQEVVEKKENREPQKRIMHPAFLPSCLPIQHIAKGTKTSYIGLPIHYCLQLRRKSLIRQLLSKSEVEWVPRVLKLQENFIYAYERIGNMWILRGAWDLTRLISVELSAGVSDELTLVFPHSSLQPCDPLRRKTLRVSELPALLDSLRAHLRKANIDFEFVPVCTPSLV